MPRTTRLFLGIAFLLMATGTMLGATGTHFLEDRITPDRLAVFEQAVYFQFFQALGLMAVAGMSYKLPESKAVRVAGWLIVAGVVLFSGTIYATTAGAPRQIGIVAMFGGIAFQIAWLTMAAIALFARSIRPPA